MLPSKSSLRIARGRAIRIPARNHAPRKVTTTRLHVSHSNKKMMLVSKFSLWGLRRSDPSTEFSHCLSKLACSPHWLSNPPRTKYEIQQRHSLIRSVQKTEIRQRAIAYQNLSGGPECLQSPNFKIKLFYRNLLVAQSRKRGFAYHSFLFYFVTKT